MSVINLISSVLLTDGTVGICAAEQGQSRAAGIPAARWQRFRHTPRRAKGKTQNCSMLNHYVSVRLLSSVSQRVIETSTQITDVNFLHLLHARQIFVSRLALTIFC